MLLKNAWKHLDSQIAEKIGSYLPPSLGCFGMMKSHSSEVQVWWHLSGSFEKTLERRRYKLCEFSRWKVFAQKNGENKLPTKAARWIFFLHKLHRTNLLRGNMISRNLSVLQYSGDWFGSTLHIIYIYISSISATHKVLTTHQLTLGFQSKLLQVYNASTRDFFPGPFSKLHCRALAMWQPMIWSWCSWGHFSHRRSFETLRVCAVAVWIFEFVWYCFVCDGCLFSETGRPMFVKCVCEMNSRLYLVILFLEVGSVGIWVVASPHEKYHAYLRPTKSSQRSAKKQIQYV